MLNIREREERMNGFSWNKMALGALVAVAVVATSTMSMTSAAQAQSAQCGKSSGNKVLSPKVFRVIEDVQKLLEAENLGEAMMELDGIKNKNELPAYDQTVLYQFYGQIYAEREQYIQSAQALERVIRLGECILPPEQISQTVFNVGQLYIGAEQYRKGMNYLQSWFDKNPDPPASALAFMASANLGIDPPNYREALKWMLRAVEKSKSMGEEPKENWYSTLVALYMENDQMREALPIIELLVKKYPKRNYWMQLSYVYGELNRDADQFATLESAYHQGLLIKSQELVYLAQLYMANSIPDRAGDIMEEGIKAGKIERKAENLRFMADAMYTAKELDRAIPWYEEAGKASARADTLFMLGQIYMQQDEWKKAIKAFESMFAKDRQAHKDDKLRTIGTAHYNMGIALYSDGRIRDAKRFFTNAKSYKATRKGANQWLKRIASE
jgi:tetratricopeptide (TPR) repeat protein